MINRREGIPVLIIAVILAVLVFLSAAGFNLPSATQTVSAQAISTCLNRTNIPLNEMHWIYVPESASQLHTEENYYFLAGQLISSGAVDASACPSGGLTLNGYANACGMSTAKEAVIYLQNAVDEAILKAYNEIGVPPVLLKQMIRTESQFWPSNYALTHYGYGHITNIGIRNAVEWNRDLYNKVCPSSTGMDCSTSISTANEILRSLVSTCSTCEYGIDLTTANRSVDILAETVLGYCYQTAQLVFNATGWHSSMVVDYPTIWKLTLMDYNAGSECVFKAVASAFKATNGPVNWSDISAHVSGEQCVRGLTYANQITAKYYNFPP